MRDAEREELKEQLRALIAGRGDGIDLDTPFHWEVKDVKDPVRFFEHLPFLLPPNSILYVEATGIVPEVASFYAKHHATNAVAVTRDTIFPAPDIYHFTFSSEVISRLKDFAARHAVPEMFDHIKAYVGKSLLFTFHDAFSGYLLISEHVSEVQVQRFCETLGVSYRRDSTLHRDPEQLRRMLWAFENPDKVRIRVAGEPWWKSLWRRWTQ